MVNQHQMQTDPLEKRIASELWKWAFLSPGERREVTANGSDLCVMIEFYLSGIFQQFAFTRSRGIWCDGVVELSIRQMNRRAFVIVGIAFAPSQLAPFEIEFHFTRRRDKEPLRAIVRFGGCEDDGEVHWHSNLKNAAATLAKRPKCDRDWAVAVELTPMVS
jgi:hypothetical protein